MKVQVHYTETVEKTAVIEIDQAEFLEWSGGRITEALLKEFLQSEADRAAWTKFISVVAEWGHEVELDYVTMLMPGHQ